LGNNLCAVDNSISVGFIVIRLIAGMMKSSQKVNIYFRLELLKKPEPKPMCSNSITIALYKQDNPPFHPPHTARSNIPHFPTPYIWNIKQLENLMSAVDNSNI
jgi:hypothetical protein